MLRSTTRQPHSFKHGPTKELSKREMSSLEAKGEHRIPSGSVTNCLTTDDRSKLREADLRRQLRNAYHFDGIVRTQFSCTNCKI
ncbi:hypothetical protein ANCDUO_15769 [Ancylostoma duodenale]|uniref:Uncharacterized protein n=1 Tax=Ancylostoma duodenale TaxID=51022 RepID=A0A0C2GB04_9BILA|nr:hypothetical protein ANCDUO_15769 [Ancylostoma duodenale]